MNGSLAFCRCWQWISANQGLGMVDEGSTTLGVPLQHFRGATTLENGKSRLYFFCCLPFFRFSSILRRVVFFRQMSIAIGMLPHQRGLLDLRHTLSWSMATKKGKSFRFYFRFKKTQMFHPFYHCLWWFQALRRHFWGRRALMKAFRASLFTIMTNGH